VTCGASQAKQPCHDSKTDRTANRRASRRLFELIRKLVPFRRLQCHRTEPVPPQREEHPALLQRRLHLYQLSPERELSPTFRPLAHRASPRMRFVSSGRRSACSFLQAPPRRQRPCCCA